MDRYLRNTPAAPNVTFMVNETATDPDGNNVTVTIYKADGTVHTATTAATRTGTGQYKYDLPSQSALQKLTLNWTGLLSGVSTTIVTEVEIVGGFLFTVADMRSYDTVLTDLTKFPLAKVIAKRNQVENEFERICNRAFVPRFHRETMLGDGSPDLWLNKADVHNVTKLTVDGVDKLYWQTEGSLVVDKDYTKHLFLTERSGQSFPEGAVIVIEYEHGLKSVPYEVHEKAKKRARGFLTSAGNRIDERATVINADFGRVNLATPGMDMGFGRYVRSGFGVWHTGIPDIDVVLDDWIFASKGVV